MRAPSAEELAATAVGALSLAEASVKVRSGPPVDEPEDLALPVWAGVVPVHLGFSTPEPDPQDAPGTPLPSSVRALMGGPP